ncbi:MAG TPA: hypothetical protein VF622_14230 [Segetibacter sp.]|jgi:hypothetical protein
MDDEKIILPDFIIADLYKSHLIEPVKEETDEVVISTLPTRKRQNQNDEKTSSVQYLGENKKGIIILVSEPTATYIQDDELVFLTKILNACNLNISDIAIINTYNNPSRFDQLSKELKAEYIFLLGVEPASIQLPFTVPNFQVQKFSKCTIISSPVLSSMLPNTPESVALKRQLWTSLQRAFNLN